MPDVYEALREAEEALREFNAEPAAAIALQHVRAALAAQPTDEIYLKVQPMETAPSGSDALEPSEIDVSEGAWAIVLGTNAKPIGWVDTHAAFQGRTYRNRLLPKG